MRGSFSVARLSLRYSIAHLEHPDDQERKRKKNVEQKGKHANKGKRKERKEHKGRRNDTLNRQEITRLQNWIQNTV